MWDGGDQRSVDDALVARGFARPAADAVARAAV
jgi:hypothetical protein